MTALLCIAAYFLIGLCFARSQAVRLQEEVNVWHDKMQTYGKKVPPREWRAARPWHAVGVNTVGEGHFRRIMRRSLTWHTLLWPLLLVFYGMAGALDWAAAPVAKRRERVEGLRARADKMAEMLEGLSDLMEKEILEQEIEENRKLAKELEI